MKNLDATALRSAFQMLAEHFPERMRAVFMIDGEGWADMVFVCD